MFETRRIECVQAKSAHRAVSAPNTRHLSLVSLMLLLRLLLLLRMYGRITRPESALGGQAHGWRPWRITLFALGLRAIRILCTLLLIARGSAYLRLSSFVGLEDDFLGRGARGAPRSGDPSRRISDESVGDAVE